MVEPTSSFLSRRASLQAVLALPALVAASVPIPDQAATIPRGEEAPIALPAGVTPTAPGERRVGLAYSTWHRDAQWQHAPQPHRPWGTPEIGYYQSDDPKILTRHAGWLSDSGVDFVVLDWSNDLGIDVRSPGAPGMQRFIEQATIAMFDTWSALPKAPRIGVMIGNPGNKSAVADGSLGAKANEVHDLFVANPARARMLQTYLGKPLLLVYEGTPSLWGSSLPPWRDDRFTVRFVTGFLTEQKTLVTPSGVGRYGYWSWEDRRMPTYAVFDGHPECTTVVAAWRGHGSPGRDGGRTYERQWERARRVGPRFVLGGTFNEWWLSEQDSPEASKDIEPSKEFGWAYMDVLKRQASLFKAGR